MVVRCVLRRRDSRSAQAPAGYCHASWVVVAPPVTASRISSEGMKGLAALLESCCIAAGDSSVREDKGI